MEQEQKRDFKGIWISREIWLDKRLTALDKVILAEIDSLDCQDWCYASNAYLAEFCGCSKTKVSLTISKLTQLGYLKVESFDGRTRVLKSSLSKNERQTYKKCEADLQKVKAIKIDDYNNIEKENQEKSANEFAEYGFSQELAAKVNDWLKYKKEKRQTYQPSGLKVLLNRLKKDKLEHNEQYVIEEIDFSMANNYQGIYAAKSGWRASEPQQKPAQSNFSTRRNYTKEEMDEIDNSMLTPSSITEHLDELLKEL